MTDIRFTVRGIAVPQGSTKAFVVKGRAVTTNKTPALVAWRHSISDEARKVAPPSLLQGPLSVYVAFSLPRPKSAKTAAYYVSKRPDLDKLIRAVLDACTGVIWNDDAQVAKIASAKIYSGTPGCDVEVTQCQ